MINIAVVINTSQFTGGATMRVVALKILSKKNKNLNFYIIP